MNWSTFLCNNMLSFGVCACPGMMSGKVCIWDGKSKIEKGEIVILTETINEISIKIIQNAGGIISCKHTSYSHLTSMAMSLNIPCIVGAKFNRLPQNGMMVYGDSLRSILYSSKQDLNEEDDNRWYTKVVSAVDWDPEQQKIKMLAHILDGKKLDEYEKYISGVFLDSFIFHRDSTERKELVADIKKLDEKLSGRNIYYRFSADALNLKKHNNKIKNETDFVLELWKNEVYVNVFVANPKSYEDIINFKKFVHSLGIKEKIKIGTMIENQEIVNCLQKIVRDGLIDFAAIGMNDLMSSYLSLDRDNADNQKKFCLRDPRIFDALVHIKDSLTEGNIPCYIGLPKYFDFINDYEMLREIGYVDFFGTYSFFSIMEKQGGL